MLIFNYRQRETEVKQRKLKRLQLPGERQAIEQLVVEVSNHEKAMLRITANFWTNVTPRLPAENEI